MKIRSINSGDLGNVSDLPMDRLIGIAKRLEGVLRDGVFSYRELAQKTDVPRQTLHNWNSKGVPIASRFYPMSFQRRCKLLDAIENDFKSKKEFREYLGWNESYIRKVAREQKIELPDFRKIGEKTYDRKMWNIGKLAANRERVDYRLDQGVGCADIGREFGLTRQTISAYKKYRESQT